MSKTCINSLFMFNCKQFPLFLKENWFFFAVAAEIFLNKEKCLCIVVLKNLVFFNKLFHCCENEFRIFFLSDVFRFLLMQVTYFRIMEIRKRGTKKWESASVDSYVNGIFYSYMCKYSFVTSDCVMWKLSAVKILSIHPSNCYCTQNSTRFTF